MTEEKGQVRRKAGVEKRADPKGVLVRIESETFWFRPKPRSIFPKRRKLVKTMILESIIEFLCFSSPSKSESQKD